MSDTQLHRVTILIKTFLRDAHLLETIDAIQARLPEVQMLIVDDGNEAYLKGNYYHRLRKQGHVVVEMPFDSGFGAKSNEAIRQCERPYLLIGSDDFDFRPASVREGIIKLVDTLDDGYVDIASGRVNDNPYEGWLRVVNDGQGIVVVEEYIDFNSPHRTENGTTFHYCDLTVNYSLIRRDVLGFDEGFIHWDDDVKIGGGEHGAFFYDAKLAGVRVAYVPGVNITEQTNKPTDSRYPSMRGRARDKARPCFTKRGITKYVCFDGTVDWGKK
jgi:hypothetical protein